MLKKPMIILLVVLLSLPVITAAEEQENEVGEDVVEDLPENEVQEDEAEVEGREKDGVLIEVVEEVREDDEYSSEMEAGEAIPEEAEVKSQNSSGDINVSGEGSVSVEPDIGYVNFSIVAGGENINELYQDNVSTVNEVVDALVEHGVSRDNITTEGFNIRDDYRHLPPEEREKEPSYVVTTDLKVLVEDLEEEMGEVMNIGIDSGANRVSSIQFDVEDPEEHYYDALEKALENAEKKTERIADFYDASPGEVKMVNEDRAQIGRGVQMEMADAEYAEEAALGDTLPIEPGEISFESQVQVKYGLN
ncbi:SIMPL domain-containing protein [Natranaerofaba carboxydovora]|uniref:SIMPL domain-containing protein n=1 Tax=Natranaerofaba carboxydovora TaxID=2742683 RepID=UPI001F13A4B3|nr:SIMPL domain-containing protein [Natranaerofaba carboxydovora]UMZ75455.1 26 kDa periplasmic immunogenic protein [Natranaerofaba carboxydovora]